MKIQYLSLILALLFVFTVAPVAADSQSAPLLPVQLYGTITATDGTPAPVGTILTATLGDDTFTIKVTEKGKYGGEGKFDRKLIVSSNTEDGIISFTVGSIESTNTTTYEAGTVKKVDLVFSSFPVVPQENPGINGGTSTAISYSSVNPGIGTFTYTTTDGAVFEIERMTVFGALYASSHSIGKTSGASGGIFIDTIDGKSTQGTNGWMYSVNGNSPMVSANACPVSNGDKIVWWYSESMESKPETSSTKFGLIIDTTIGLPPVTNTTQNILPPSEIVIPETKPVENTTGTVTFEKTETVKAVQIAPELLAENPDVSVKVVEGNTEEIKLPANVTKEDVHLILEISVLDNAGKEVSVDTAGTFIIEVQIPAGKQLFVGHFNNGIWENCPVLDIGNGQWQVTYYSLSPFSIVLLDEGKETPFVEVPAPTETVPTEIPTPTPTTTQETPTATPTEEAKSPLSVFALTGILAGAGLLSLKRRNEP